jgi:hypothetical protein
MKCGVIYIFNPTSANAEKQDLRIVVRQEVYHYLPGIRSKSLVSILIETLYDPLRNASGTLHDAFNVMLWELSISNLSGGNQEPYTVFVRTAQEAKL